MRLALALVLGLALEARADTRSDAIALARDVVEKHRTSEHRDRFLVEFPEVGAVPERGAVRIEARTGRYEREETGVSLVLGPEGARVDLVSRTHVPTFVARAASKRDSWRLLECRVPLARARTALLAIDLLAGAREKPRDGTKTDPLDPRLDAPEATSEGDWPRMTLEVEGRRAARRGSFAELARLVLEELGKESGLAPPLERDRALRRLLPALDQGGDAAARAAFILGDVAFPEAWPKLAALDTEEGRDARAKIQARGAKDARAALLALSTRSASWDVRAWARELLDRREWVDAVLASKDVAEDPVVEALRAVPRETKDERVGALLGDGRPLVRIEAAALLLGSSTRAREVLVSAARDATIGAEARETAVARLGASLAPEDLGSALGPVVTDASAPPSVRAEAARALDGAPDAASALASALDEELVQESSSDEARRDLRLALIAALAGVGSKDAREALSRAALASADEDARRLAIHAIGSLDGEDKTVASALENESAREPASARARRAAEVETAARSKDDATRLEAIADAVCEAPLRSTIARLVRAARDSKARELLKKRLRERGELGETGLEVLDKTEK